MRRLATITAGVILFLSELAIAQDLTLGGYSFVGFTRASRVAFDISFSANITNSATDVQNVIATLTSSSPYTIVIDGDLVFGDVAAGSTVASSDSFTIRHDRRFPFSWSNLNWNVAYDTGSLGITLDQGSAVSDVITTEGGTLSTVGSDGSSYTLTVPPNALQDMQEITLTPASLIGLPPLGQNILAAVHLSPSGLKLNSNAVLTITGYQQSSTQMIPLGFLIQDNSEGFRLISSNIEVDTVTLEVPHFSVAGLLETELQELAVKTLEKYREFITHLTSANRCTAIEMGLAIKDAAEIAVNTHLLAEYYVDVRGFNAPEDVLGFNAHDCVYQNQLDDVVTQYEPCSSFSDFGEATKVSLKNRIDEMFGIFDLGCTGPPGNSSLEQNVLECIGLGTFLSQLELLPDVGGDGFGDYGETLFEKKTCGIASLEVSPDFQHLPIGGSIQLQAIARNDEGRVIEGREVIWRNENNSVVSVAGSPTTADVTGLQGGHAWVTAEDRITSEAATEIILSPKVKVPIIPFVADSNKATSNIYVGGAVTVSPPRLTLILPEFDIMRATLFAPDGANITPLTGWNWKSNDSNVARVVSSGGREGTVFPVDAGMATITATETGTGLKGTAQVIVGVRVNVTPPEVCLRVFEATQLSAKVLDWDGDPFPGVDPFDIVWFSPDDSTVSVNIDGVVIAQSEGHVQIEATYKNSTGFSTVFVPRFPDDYTVTPVYAPPFFNWNGMQYSSAYRLNDVGEVENTKREALKSAALCEIADALPARIIKNDTGFYTYVGADNFAYIFDSNTCEEFEIPISALQSPTPVAINDHGHVAGTIIGGEGERAGFVYEFGKLEGDPVTFITAGCNTDIFDINNNGDVIGSAGACIVQATCNIEGQEEPETYLRKTSDGSNFIYSNGGYFVLPGSIPGVPMKEGDSKSCLGVDTNTGCLVPRDGCTANDPVEGQEWIRPSAINDQGVLIGNYRYWDDNFGWYQMKGYIYDDQGNYRLLDPPFPLTLPVQAEWSFADINNRDDILISSRPLAREELLEDFVYSVMHLCPLQ